MTTPVMNELTTGVPWLQDIEGLLFSRPKTLIEGEYYAYRDGHQSDKPAMFIVKFVAYTSCPAIVVVSNGSGLRVRCPRDGLFQLTQEAKKRINGISNEPR